MGRSLRPEGVFDTELEHLPQELRWREWMARVEAAIFAAPAPVPRELLARLIGRTCSLDLLIEDIANALADRPYEIVFAGGGWQFRTRPRHADTIRTAFAGGAGQETQLSETEMVVLASIAYHQPVTRGALSDILGSQISRDTVSRLRRLGFIASGPRSPQPGAPYTYVTTGTFLSHFGLETLRDLPDLEALEDAGLIDRETRARDGMPIANGMDGNDEVANRPEDDDGDLSVGGLN